MKERVVLPIDVNPFVKTYTYHGFYNSIISGQMGVEKVPVIVEVTDFEKHVWQKQAEELIYTTHGNRIEFCANKWNTNMNACLWRECKKNDIISIDIIKQAKSNIWGAINLFITSKEQNNMLDDDKYFFRLGNFTGNNVYLRIENNQIFTEHFNGKRINLKIEKQGGDIKICFGDEYNEIKKAFLPGNTYDEMLIGFEVKLGNNVYNEWLLSNYIQIFGNINAKFISIDFWSIPRRDGHMYETNYFLEYGIEYLTAFEEYGINPLDVIRANLNMGNYIEMWVNEDILDGLEVQAGRPHFHQNLIYGYDEKNEELLLLQYVRGKLTSRTMRYCDFLSERNKSSEFTKFVIVRVKEDTNRYSFELKYLVDMLEEYYYSKPSARRTQHMLMPHDSIYGMDLMKQLMISEKMFYDLRISHLLFEKATIMRMRIDYLLYRGFLDSKQYKILLELVSEEVHLCESMKNLILKNDLFYDEKNIGRIRSYMEKIICCEDKYLPILIGYLKLKC